MVAEDHMREGTRSVLPSQRFVPKKSDARASTSYFKPSDIEYSLSVAIEANLCEAFREIFGFVFVDDFEMQLSSLDTFAVSLQFRSPLAYSEIPYTDIAALSSPAYDEATTLIKNLGGSVLAGFFTTVRIGETCVGMDDLGQMICLFTVQVARCLRR
jgi:hypothetical protein